MPSYMKNSVHGKAYEIGWKSKIMPMNRGGGGVSVSFKAEGCMLAYSSGCTNSSYFSYWKGVEIIMERYQNLPFPGTIKL